MPCGVSSAVNSACGYTDNAECRPGQAETHLHRRFQEVQFVFNFVIGSGAAFAPAWTMHDQSYITSAAFACNVPYQHGKGSDVAAAERLSLFFSHQFCGHSNDGINTVNPQVPRSRRWYGHFHPRLRPDGTCSTARGLQTGHQKFSLRALDPIGHLIRCLRSRLIGDMTHTNPVLMSSPEHIEPQWPG